VKNKLRVALFRAKSCRNTFDKYFTGVESNMASPVCSLCASPLCINENQLGVHCEGLLCNVCGCNARNRFFYFVLKNRIEGIGPHRSLSQAVKVLEASSYGYASMGKRYTEMMAELNARIVCSDYNEANFKAMVKEDLSALNLEERSLDIICHSHVLEHVEDDIEAMQEAIRCLKPGGELLVSVPIQTDFTFQPQNEYHGDNAYVFRRNGWDIIAKLKHVGFHVEVAVPPEHVALNALHQPEADQYVLDDVRFASKFGINFQRYRELFYRACGRDASVSHRFAEIWGQLEVFVARKTWGV
jgi:SAM-dependent methyltransferase